jgi:hypothetical protein
MMLNIKAVAGAIMTTAVTDTTKKIFWHRELPPADAEPVAEHTIDAESGRVPGTLAHRDEIWDDCYTDLMTQVSRRLDQEIERLGGEYAHILSESIEPRHNDAAGEAWLRGRFTYVLYRKGPS